MFRDAVTEPTRIKVQTVARVTTRKQDLAGVVSFDGRCVHQIGEFLGQRVRRNLRLDGAHQKRFVDDAFDRLDGLNQFVHRTPGRLD